MCSLFITRNESTTVQEESFQYLSGAIAFLWGQVMGGHLTLAHSIMIEKKKDKDNV